jgi:putative secretion ATPase (PEP-CTERM system associated)
MYESHFGFSQRPFQLSPDPSFFYNSKLHARALAYLQYGLSLGEGFIVITGHIGTGKTTLARSLLSMVKANDVVAAQLVTTKLAPTELLGLVCSEFGLKVEGQSKAELLQMLESFFKQLHRINKRALLIVDEAQNLPQETIEELRMLSNFQLDGKPLLQSFLLGQDELRGIISTPNMEQFRQRIIASCHLSPLDAEELKHYVEHRLKHVGWQGHNPTISAEAYQEIFENTSGIPRKINIFCDRLLLFCFLENIIEIKASTVNEVVNELKEELTGAVTGAPLLDHSMQVPQSSPQLVSRRSSSNIEEKPLAVSENQIKHWVEEHMETLLKEHRVRLTRYVNLLVKNATAEIEKVKGKK